MKVEFPDEVESFKQRLCEIFKNNGYDCNKFTIFGGCIRDYFLNVSMKDVDIRTSYKLKNLHKLLEKYNIESKYRKFGEDLVTLKINVNNIEFEFINIGRNLNDGDYTVNNLSANFETNQINNPEFVTDVENKILKLNRNTPDVVYRGIYMIYKFPDFTFDPKTLKMLKQHRIPKSTLTKFIDRKNLDYDRFMTIARNYDLDKCFKSS